MVSKIEVTRRLLPASPKAPLQSGTAMSEWLRAADGNGGPLAHRGHQGDCLGRLILSQ